MSPGEVKQYQQMVITTNKQSQYYSFTHPTEILTSCYQRLQGVSHIRTVINIVETSGDHPVK